MLPETFVKINIYFESTFNSYINLIALKIFSKKTLKVQLQIVVRPETKTGK